MVENSHSHFLNRDSASDFVKLISDPNHKILLEFVLGAATTHFIKWEGMSEEEYQSQLPEAPFDLLFYIKLVDRIFIDKDRVKLFNAIEKEERRSRIEAIGCDRTN